MSISVRERILLRDILVKFRGSFTEMILVEDLIQQVNISAGEVSTLKMRDRRKGDSFSIVWDQEEEEKMGEKEIPVNEDQVELLKGKLKFMSDNKEVGLEILGLCKKINALEGGETIK